MMDETNNNAAEAATNEEAATAGSAGAQVTIFSTPVCHYCQAAKAFFGENNVTYEDINVAEDAEKRQEMIEMTGQMGVPVIKIGDDIVVGFDETKVRELLGMS